MTADEISNSSPREIYRRINGYQTRMRNRRLFIGSFVTVPVINAGANAPRKGVTLKDILPDDVRDAEGKAVDAEYSRHMAEVMEDEERKRKEGKAWKRK